MIIKPGFCDHWKVVKLKRISGQAAVVEWLLRLLGSCETRKNWTFDANDPEAIAGICGYQGDAKEFVTWFVDARFLDHEGDKLVVHHWREHNGHLIARWQNGQMGGRPIGTGKQPQIAELKDFCKSIGLNGNEADKIFDHWKANGFKTSKHTIKDWKAFVRNWQRRLPDFNRNSPEARRDRSCL